jgi:hypothetical protein
MVPVQRTEKALGSSFAGSGEVEFQSKSICLSVRVMAGGPVSESLLKYSALRPSSVEPCATRNCVRGMTIEAF